MGVRDGTWTVDLLWKYLHETNTPAKAVGSHYQYMDPNGELDDRRKVYDMLVSDTKNTSPKDVDEAAASMIPWNQHNKGIVKKFGNQYACGSVVKIAFQRYMVWKSGDDYHSRPVKQRGWNAIQWLVKSLDLGLSAQPHMSAVNHYVGIVGYRTKDVVDQSNTGYTRINRIYEFLVMDPWPGGYATANTKTPYSTGHSQFLGVAKQVDKGLKYDGNDITSLEGPHPF